MLKVIFALCFALLCTPLLAQTVSGTISGTVRDPADAVIVNARVTLLNEATGATREAVTDEQGGFIFPSVQPGLLTVSVEQPGFKTFRKSGIPLTANERLPVMVRMELGTTTESVNVRAEGATVQTASAERSGLVTEKQLSTLMLKGRDFMGLLRTLPGVVDTNAREAPSNNSLVGLYIQGGRQGTYNLTLDGVTNLDTGSNVGPYFEPSVDAIAEVKVLMTNYQAEYGRNSGASINVIMKGGSRELHGSGYYYKRNEALNANNFFNNATSRPRERYRYDLFGYTIGGPIRIPKLLKTRDKLFFFWSHEIAPQRVPVPIGFRSTPTDLERRGNFSETREADGRLIPIRDPASGQPFPGNIVPANRINPSGQAILNLLPAPNTTSPTRQFNYAYQATIDRPRHVEMLRVDWAISSATTFYVRGIHSYEKLQGGIGFTGTSANWPMFPMKYDLTGRGLAMNLTHVFSPTVVNEFTAGVNRGVQDRGPLDDAALAANQRSKNGLAGLGQFRPDLNPLDIVPNATFGGVPNALNLNVEPKFPFVGRNNIWNYSDNLSWSNGPHTFRFGVYFEPTSRNTRRESIFQGAFDFSRDPNNPLDTNWAWSNALLGNFVSYTESDRTTFAHGRFQNLEWYAQDAWRVNRKLSLDFGVRFYWAPPNYTSDDKLASFAPEVYQAARAPRLYQPALVNGVRVARNPVTGQTQPAVLIGAFVPGTGDVYNGMVLAGQGGAPRGLINSRGIHYAPRFGFAYDVFGNGKTAVRGGAGVFYDRLQTDVALELAENPPMRNTPVVFYNNIGSYLQSSGSLFPTNVKAVDGIGKVPTVMNWSLGVQQMIGFGTIFDVAYVGSVARHLMVQRNINALPYGTNFLPQNADPAAPARPLPVNFLRPYAGLGDILYRETSSTSNYHAMQVQVNRRFARSLQYGLAWTWSKSMSFADGNFSQVAMYAPLRAWNYGKASYDRTHNLVLTYTWDLPKASGKWQNPVAKMVLDDWQLAGITSFISGSPLGVSLATTDNADIGGGGDGVRPVMIANPVLPKSERTVDRYLNTNAFGRPERGTFGNAPKDVFRGPGVNNWDLSVFKNFPLGKETRRLQFRWELYNAWNHTQFNSVDTAARFNPQGQQVNTRFGSLIGAASPRQMQLSLRFSF